MATIEIPIESVRIPRIAKGAASVSTRELYKLFGYSTWLLAKNADDEVHTLVTPTTWTNHQVVSEFDRLMILGADEDPVGLPILHLNPMEFVKIPTDGYLIKESAVYDALGIDYRVVVRDNGERYAVLRDCVTHFVKHDVDCNEPASTIGKPKVSQMPVGIRAARIAVKSQALSPPKVIKFATTYAGGDAPQIMALAKLCGLKYTRETFEYRMADGHWANTPMGETRVKYAYILEGFSECASTRAQDYMRGPLAKEAAKRGIQGAAFYLRCGESSKLAATQKEGTTYAEQLSETADSFREKAAKDAELQKCQCGGWH